MSCPWRRGGEPASGRGATTRGQQRPRGVPGGGEGRSGHQVLPDPEVLGLSGNPGAPDGEGGGRPPSPGRARLGTRGR
jgi:hypothetical protein